MTCTKEFTGNTELGVAVDENHREPNSYASTDTSRERRPYDRSSSRRMGVSVVLCGLRE
jgi:hypothetical protein